MSGLPAAGFPPPPAWPPSPPLPADPGEAFSPTRVRLAEELAEEESFLEIRDRRSREVITVIELLSPTNKRSGPDREQMDLVVREVLPDDYVAWEARHAHAGGRCGRAL